MAVPLDFGCLDVDARGVVLSDPTKSDRSASTRILNGTSTGLRTESPVEAEAEFSEIFAAAIEPYAALRERRVGTPEIAPDLIG